MRFRPPPAAARGFEHHGGRVARLEAEGGVLVEKGIEIRHGQRVHIRHRDSRFPRLDSLVIHAHHHAGNALHILPRRHAAKQFGEGDIAFALTDRIQERVVAMQLGAHLVLAVRAAHDDEDMRMILLDPPRQCQGGHRLLERGGEAHHAVLRPVHTGVAGLDKGGSTLAGGEESHHAAGLIELRALAGE